MRSRGHSSSLSAEELQRRIVPIIAIVVVVVGLAWMGRTQERRTFVARSLPAVPAAVREQPMLQQRIADAEAEAQQPWSPERGLAELGRLYHANGFLPEAARIYQRLADIEPRNPRWPYLLATLLGGYGRLDEALPLFHLAVNLAPDYLPAQLRLAEAQFKSRDATGAAATYAAVLARNRDNTYAQLGLARIDAAARQWPAARARLERILAFHPDFTPAWGLLVLVCEQLGDAPAVRTARERTANSGSPPSPDPWVDALLDDCYDVYRLNVAAAAAGLTSRAEAVRLLQRALEIAPGNAATHRLLGNQYEKSGDMPEARRHLEQAAELEPDADVNWTALILFLNRQNETVASEQALNRGLQHQPHATGLLFERSRRLMDNGRYAEALVLLEELKQRLPEDAEIHVKSALVHFRMDNVPAGLADMRAALERKPNHPLALLALLREAFDKPDRAAAQELILRLRQAEARPEDLQDAAQEFRTRFGRPP